MTFKVSAIVRHVVQDILKRKMRLDCKRYKDGSIAIDTKKLQRILRDVLGENAARDIRVTPLPDRRVLIYMGPEMIQWARGKEIPRGRPGSNRFERLGNKNTVGLYGTITLVELSHLLGQVYKAKRVTNVPQILRTFEEPLEIPEAIH